MLSFKNTVVVLLGFVSGAAALQKYYKVYHHQQCRKI
jgi:hypothetical protein